VCRYRDANVRVQRRQITSVPRLHCHLARVTHWAHQQHTLAEILSPRFSAAHHRRTPTVLTWRPDGRRWWQCRRAPWWMQANAKVDRLKSVRQLCVSSCNHSDTAMIHCKWRGSVRQNCEGNRRLRESRVKLIRLITVTVTTQRALSDVYHWLETLIVYQKSLQNLNKTHTHTCIHTCRFIEVWQPKVGLHIDNWYIHAYIQIK